MTSTKLAVDDGASSEARTNKRRFAAAASEHRSRDVVDVQLYPSATAWAALPDVATAGSPSRAGAVLVIACSIVMEVREVNERAAESVHALSPVPQLLRAVDHVPVRDRLLAGLRVNDGPLLAGEARLDECLPLCFLLPVVSRKTTLIMESNSCRRSPTITDA
jgi:hypothetical protein